MNWFTNNSNLFMYLTTVLEKRERETKEEIMLVFINTPSKVLHN